MTKDRAVDEPVKIFWFSQS